MINRELMDLLERFAPKEYACSWDNVGLLIGRADQEIQRVVVALDATNAVVDRAVAEGADLIITHHACFKDCIICYITTIIITTTSIPCILGRKHIKNSSRSLNIKRGKQFRVQTVIL